MLHRVDVYNRGGFGRVFTIGQTTDGIILTGVDGLDPTKATVNLKDYSQTDGAEFHSARRESRNILMGFALDSRYGGRTIRDLRERLYEVFMPESDLMITLRLENNLVVKTDGIAESIQSPMFTKEPIAVASIICPSADFVETSTLSGSGEGSHIDNWYEINYTGSVPTGLSFEIVVNNDATSNGFSVRLKSPRNLTRILRFSAPLQGGDVVRIVSTPGQRTATLTRAGTTRSIMNGIVPNSIWPMLERGNNQLNVLTTGGQFYYEYEYQRRFGGL